MTAPYLRVYRVQFSSGSLWWDRMITSYLVSTSWSWSGQSSIYNLVSTSPRSFKFSFLGSILYLNDCYVLFLSAAATIWLTFAHNPSFCHICTFSLAGYLILIQFKLDEFQLKLQTNCLQCIVFHSQFYQKNTLYWQRGSYLFNKNNIHSQFCKK